MTSLQVKGVLDMTFLDIREEGDFQNGLTQRLQVMLNSPTKFAGSPKKTKEHIKAVRLSNNYMTTVDFIYPCLSSKIDVGNVLWLDLSFNSITTIADDFAKLFPNLTTIYLHANKIHKLQDIKKLGAIENLKSVSLYGNPVEEHKHYRNFVLYSCPKLIQFDASPVTKSEIQRMEVWAQTFRNKLNPQEEL